MTGKPFPPGLREWVATNLPGLDEVTDVSWPRGRSQVWRVVAGPSVAFVKLSPTALDFDREVVGAPWWRPRPGSCRSWPSSCRWSTSTVTTAPAIGCGTPRTATTG